MLPGLVGAADTTALFLLYKLPQRELLQLVADFFVDTSAAGALE